MPLVYFDYNATTPLDEGVREAMAPFLEGIYGNPSSIHQIGRQARVALDEARDKIAVVFQAKPSEIVFTSGGTESNNLALFGAARKFRDHGKHLVVSSIEHHAVLHSCRYLAAREGFEITYLPVDQDGFVRLEDVALALRPDTLLVSVMAANNETGTIEPVAEIGRLCRERGVLFHTDAAQWFGKEPLVSIHEFEADLVSICAHKFHGPKGVGALYIRSPLQLDPILFGGGHEQERRAGTENVAGIAGLAQAAGVFLRNPVFSRAHLEPLTARLLELLECTPGVVLRGSRRNRLANTVACTVEGCDSISLLAGLDLEGVCASSGSACSAGSLEPSHVLMAMQAAPALANSFVRFSLGRESTLSEVEYVGSVLGQIIHRIRGHWR